jgi:hypothetical protein
LGLNRPGDSYIGMWRFTGPATQPYSATEVDMCQLLAHHKDALPVAQRPPRIAALERELGELES